MSAAAPGIFGRAASASFRLAATAGRRSVTAAASGPRASRLAWTSAGAWGAAAARSRGATCPAAAAGMSSSSGPAAASATAADPALAPSTIIDEEGTAGATHNGAGKLATLESLPFDNRFTAELPADDSEAKQPRQVGAGWVLAGCWVLGDELGEADASVWGVCDPRPVPLDRCRVRPSHRHRSTPRSSAGWRPRPPTRCGAWGGEGWRAWGRRLLPGPAAAALIASALMAPASLMTPQAQEPTTLAVSAAVARLVGLDPEEGRRPEFGLIFSGGYAPAPGIMLCGCMWRRRQQRGCRRRSRRQASHLAPPTSGAHPPAPAAGNAPLPQTRSYAQCYGGAWGLPGGRRGGGLHASSRGVMAARG